MVKSFVEHLIVGVERGDGAEPSRSRTPSRSTGGGLSCRPASASRCGRSSARYRALVYEQRVVDGRKDPTCLTIAFDIDSERRCETSEIGGDGEPGVLRAFLGARIARTPFVLATALRSFWQLNISAALAG
jgi:hypothetical protein